MTALFGVPTATSLLSMCRKDGEVSFWPSTHAVCVCFVQENVEFSTELAFATILEDLNHTGVLSAEMPHAYRHDPNGAPLFQSISHRPVAAASLGQVYKATTVTP